MSDFNSTNLRLMIGALSPAFDGTPQEFIAELVRLSTIVSPNGVYYVVVSDTAPTSNLGIWLKDGTKPYVWDEGTSAYIPADLTDSLTSILAAIAALQSQAGSGRLIFSATEPAAADRTNSVWVETVAGRLIALRYWDGVVWAFVPDRFPSITTTGTANAQVATFGVPGITLASLENKILYLTPVATNTGAVTLAVDGTAATQIRVGSSALSAGQFEAGREHQVVYDGVYYRLLNPSIPDVLAGGTYTNVTGFTANTKGQVTSVMTSGGSSVIRASVVFDGSVALLSKTSASVDSATNKVVFGAAHGWSSGQLVWIQTTSAIAGLDPDVPYYVNVTAPTEVMLYKTKAGALAANPTYLADITVTGAIAEDFNYWDGAPLFGTPYNVDGVIKDINTFYFVDFTDDLPDEHYAVSGSVMAASAAAGAYFLIPDGILPTVSGCWVAAGSTTYLDSARFSVICV